MRNAGRRRFRFAAGNAAVWLAAMTATPLSRLRLVGLLEGLSFLVLLLVAMPLKYMAGQPLAVRYVGMAHGVLFLLYLAALIPVALDFKWDAKRIGLAVLASLLPAGPFAFDRKVLKPLETSRQG